MWLERMRGRGRREGGNCTTRSEIIAGNVFSLLYTHTVFLLKVILEVREVEREGGREGGRRILLYISSLEK